MTTPSGETLRTPSSLSARVGDLDSASRRTPECLAANTSSPQAVALGALGRVRECLCQVTPQEMLSWLGGAGSGE